MLLIGYVARKVCYVTLMAKGLANLTACLAEAKTVLQLSIASSVTLHQCMAVL